MLTTIDLRALGGSSERKRRADRAFGENGLNRVVTSDMNLVIILGAGAGSPGGRSRFRFSRVRRLEAASQWLSTGRESIGS